MPIARKSLVSLEATPYYHIVSRCCRRCFILGKDAITKKDYSHRQEWIENRLEELPKIFNIKIASYAIMSNHFHLVVFIDQEESKQLTDLEIAHRWHQLYKGTMLTQKFANGESLSSVELNAVTIKINEWRERLLDLGWFVKNINEPLARMANAEDKCTGKFWEGRFKSQALLDEKALLACMAYVDLNPIRAKMADTPEKSDHTSIKKRAKKAKQSKVPNRLDQQEDSLLNFAGKPRENMPKGIPFTLTNYLELVDWTGRQVRKNKRGNIDQSLPKILQRLNIEQDQWLHITQNFESSFKGIVGDTLSLVSKMKDFKRTRTLGYSNSLFYFGK